MVHCANNELRKEIFQLHTEVKKSKDEILTLGKKIKYHEDETIKLRAEVESHKATISRMDEDMGDQAEYFGFCMQDMKTVIGYLDGSKRDRRNSSSYRFVRPGV
jgi:chromosome segregation ATPase